jgi:predicted urease superfamily metal-dependent hydrolase
MTEENQTQPQMELTQEQMLQLTEYARMYAKEIMQHTISNVEHPRTDDEDGRKKAFVSCLAMILAAAASCKVLMHEDKWEGELRRLIDYAIAIIGPVPRPKEGQPSRIVRPKIVIN